MHLSGAIIAKLLVCVALTAVTPWVLSSLRIRNLDAKTFSRMCMVLFFLTRVGAFVALSAAGAQGPRSDVQGIYYPSVKLVRQGAIANRDFYSDYGPLFPYWAALPTLIWDSPNAIVAMTMLLELFALLIWTKLFRMFLAPEVERRALLLYLLNPLPMTVSWSGLNQSWILMLLGISLLLLFRGREVRSGIAYGLSLVAVKILPLIYLPALFFAARRQVRWIVGLGGIFVAAYVPFLLLGMDPFAPLTHQRVDFTPGNLVFLSGLSLIAPRLANAMLPLTWLLACGLLVWLWQRRQFSFLDVCRAICFLQLILAVFSWKAYPTYFAMCFFPFCALSVFHQGAWRLARWLLFSSLLTIEPSLWFHLIRHQGQIDYVLKQGSAGYVFLGVEILLVASSVAYLWEIARDIARASARDEPREDIRA